MKKRTTKVEVENGTILEVPSCVPEPDLDKWETLIRNGEFPCRDFGQQEDAEKFLQEAQQRFPQAKIKLEPPTSQHAAHWVVFTHK